MSERAEANAALAAAAAALRMAAAGFRAAGLRKDANAALRAASAAQHAMRPDEGHQPVEEQSGSIDPATY